MMSTDETQLPLVAEHLRQAAAHWEAAAPRYEELVRGLTEAGRTAQDQSSWVSVPPHERGHTDEELEGARRTAAQDLVRHIWVGRKAMRSLRDELTRQALDGTLDVESALSAPARFLAQGIVGRTIPDDLGQRVIELTLDWDESHGGSMRRQAWPPAGPTGASGALVGDEGIDDLGLAVLVHEAACQLRSAGRLREAFWAFTWSRAAWFTTHLAPVDAVLPGGPGRCDYGVPFVASHSGESTVAVLWRAPHHFSHPEQLPWSWWDHVVGCGTTIDDAFLAGVGVPAHKRHVVEVHRGNPWPLDPLPLLTGRVVVVDDISQGTTACTLAQVWRASLVSASGLEPRWGKLKAMATMYWEGIVPGW